MYILHEALVSDGAVLFLAYMLHVFNYEVWKAQEKNNSDPKTNLSSLRTVKLSYVIATWKVGGEIFRFHSK